MSKLNPNRKKKHKHKHSHKLIREDEKPEYTIRLQSQHGKYKIRKSPRWFKSSNSK